MKFGEAAELLGVPVDAPLDEVKRAYRRLALQVWGGRAASDNKSGASPARQP